MTIIKKMEARALLLKALQAARVGLKPMSFFFLAKSISYNPQLNLSSVFSFVFQMAIPGELTATWKI